MPTSEKPGQPSSIQTIVESRARLGESPVWDHDRQQLFWVDVYNHRLHQFDLATGRDRFLELEDVVCTIALTDGESLLLGLSDRLVLLNLETGELSTLHQFEFPYPDTRFNDGRCDAQGRFWVGTLSEATGQAELYRYDPDGTVQVMETGLTISNGLGWSPDRSTFYLTDSAPRLIYAYDFEESTGKISNRRVLVDLSAEIVEPDGLAIDANGNLWSALWNGWSIACFDPNGTEMMRVKLSVQRPTSLTFGGADLTDLYVTSASVGLSQKEIQQNLHAGDLFQFSPSNAVGLRSHRFNLKSAESKYSNPI